MRTRASLCGTERFPGEGLRLALDAVRFDGAGLLADAKGAPFLNAFPEQLHHAAWLLVFPCQRRSLLFEGAVPLSWRPGPPTSEYRPLRLPSELMYLRHQAPRTRASSETRIKTGRFVIKHAAGDGRAKTEASRRRPRPFAGASSFV
jgi:hypothetical protein